MSGNREGVPRSYKRCQGIERVSLGAIRGVRE